MGYRFEVQKIIFSFRQKYIKSALEKIKSNNFGGGGFSATPLLRRLIPQYNQKTLVDQSDNYIIAYRKTCWPKVVAFDMNLC